MKKTFITLMSAGAMTLVMADGAALFKRCAICHGEHAQKRSLNVSKVIAGWDADKIVKRLHAYKAKQLNQYGFGNMMYGQATKLSEKEMRQVAEYVQGLKPPK